MKLNDKSINDSTNAWYAYKAYFENHLSYSKSTKSNLLSYCRYYNDTCEKLDNVGTHLSSTFTESANKGFTDRKELFAGSKWVYFCVNLHNDITTLRIYIPSGIKICFQFDRSSDQFCLLSHDDSTNFIIELDDIRMSAKRYKPEKIFRDLYDNQLKLKQNPTLAIDRSLLKEYVFKSGTSDLSHYNLIRGSQ